MNIEMCSICAGERIVLDGKPCICENGTQAGEVFALRKRLFAALDEIHKLKEALKNVLTATCGGSFATGLMHSVEEAQKLI